MTVQLAMTSPLPLVPPMSIELDDHAVLRTGHAGDAEQIHALIMEHLEEGHLLPRQVEELRVHAARFVVAERAGRVIACAELAPLGNGVAEVRSLVVHRDAREGGLGRRLVSELLRMARLEEYRELCAFSHTPAYFVRMGFSIVPHTWVPEKIAVDCHRCPLFRKCGQSAVVLSLAGSKPVSPALVRG
jgi:N-acetylglutamate synthase-like GNAT family acetyltransferase